MLEVGVRQAVEARPAAKFIGKVKDGKQGIAEPLLFKKDRIFQQAYQQTSPAAKELMHGAEAKANKFREVASAKASAFKDVASKQADQFKTVATEQWENTRVRAKELHVSAEDYIRENPTKCVLGALGIGFIAGLIMRR